MSDRSSLLRKRALRQLAREQYADFRELYDQVLSQAPGLNRHQARGRACTRLRHKYPDRYLELFALAHLDGTTDIPPGIRAKSWQRASARLADLRKAGHREHYDQFRADGMSKAKAWERATTAIRNRNPDLFARLLADEYNLWLTMADEPSSTSKTQCGQQAPPPPTGRTGTLPRSPQR